MISHYSPKAFDDVTEALKHAEEIYNSQIRLIVDANQKLHNGESLPSRISGFYPGIRMRVAPHDISELADNTQAYGIFHRSGTYESTVTRPDIMWPYYTDVLERLRRNHPNVQIEVFESDVPIPHEFAVHENIKTEGKLDGDRESQQALLKSCFDMYHRRMSIRDPKEKVEEGVFPLFWFNGPRTDLSINKLRYYTGTDAANFQKYVLFTNYTDDLRSFQRFGEQLVEGAPDYEDDPYIALVATGNKVVSLRKGWDEKDIIRSVTKASANPTLPAMHLVRKSGKGVSITKVDVGAPNTLNITDHLAALRPDLVMMMGHSGGLRRGQSLHDYVIPTGVINAEQIFRRDNPVMPVISEVHEATKQGMRKALDIKSPDEFRRRVNQAPVISTLFRNRSDISDTQADEDATSKLFEESRAVSIDMETGFMLQSLFYHHVGGAAFLRISDLPEDGVTKTDGMSSNFRNKTTAEQTAIGIETMHALHANVRSGEIILPVRQVYSSLEACPAR